MTRLGLFYVRFMDDICGAGADPLEAEEGGGGGQPRARRARAREAPGQDLHRARRERLRLPGLPLRPSRGWRSRGRPSRGPSNVQPGFTSRSRRGPTAPPRLGCTCGDGRGGSRRGSGVPGHVGGTRHQARPLIHHGRLSGHLCLLLHTHQKTLVVAVCERISIRPRNTDLVSPALSAKQPGRQLVIRPGVAIITTQHRHRRARHRCVRPERASLLQRVGVALLQSRRIEHDWFTDTLGREHLPTRGDLIP